MKVYLVALNQVGWSCHIPDGFRIFDSEEKAFKYFKEMSAKAHDIYYKYIDDDEIEEDNDEKDSLLHEYTVWKTDNFLQSHIQFSMWEKEVE